MKTLYYYPTFHFAHTKVNEQFVVRKHMAVNEHTRLLSNISYRHILK